MRKPLPCESCIIFPICRSVYIKHKPSKKDFIRYNNFLTGNDLKFLRSLMSKCSIIKKYFNDYLKSETFYYRRRLLLDYYETQIEESE